MRPVRRITIRQNLSQGINGVGTYIRRKSDQFKAKVQTWKDNLRNINVEYQRLREIIERMENFQRRMNIINVALLLACLILLASILFSLGTAYGKADHQDWSEEVKSHDGQYQGAVPSAGSSHGSIESQQHKPLEVRPYQETNDSTKNEIAISSQIVKKEEPKELSMRERIRKFFDDVKEQVRMMRQQERFQLQQRNKDSFLGMALQKYQFYQKNLKQIQKQIVANNSVMIHRVKKYGQHYKGEMQYGPQRLKLFPFTTVVETSPYLFQSYWQLFQLSVVPFLIDQNGWGYLQEMLEDRRVWKSRGYFLTVGCMTASVFDYRNSDFNLFVPSIIRFVLPASVPDGTQFSIYGIRMRYDLYLKKETYVFRDLLGKFRMARSEQKMKNGQDVEVDFYCESIKCQQAFSLVKIISTRRIQIVSLKIDSVFAYHWNEERKYYGQLA